MTKNLHVLIIDKDEDFLFITKRLLEKQHFTTSTLPVNEQLPDNNFIEATNTIRNIQPDLILLEYHFFGKQLSDMCNKLRSFYTGVLILVAEKEAVLKQYRDFQADGYLAKPFNTETFVKFIQAHVAG